MIELFPNCGAYEIIMMLHELHNRGYEQLRILSGMSPNGCCWRWSIYPKIAMGDCADAERKIRGVHCDCPSGSLGRERSNDDYFKMADLFLDKYKSLFNVARLPDKDYIRWFQDVVEHAQNNEFPIAYDDFFNAEEWEFMGGEPLKYPPFELTDVNQISDEDLIEFEVNHGLYKHEIKEVIDFPYVKPTHKEIAAKIRQAYAEKKELISHIDTAGWQTLEIQYQGAETIAEHDGEVHLKLKTGETVILRDTIELFVWAPSE